MKKNFFFKYYKNFIQKICDFIIEEKTIKNINKKEKDTVFANFIKLEKIIKINFFFYDYNNKYLITDHFFQKF